MGAPSRCSHCAGPLEKGTRWCPKCGAVASWITPTGQVQALPTAYLLVQSPGGRVRKAPISTTVVRVGRSPTCEVIVKHPRVSRVHATLELRDGAYHLADARSSGGTFLEGRPVHGAVKVKAGATIRLGRNEEDSVTLVYHEEEPDSVPVDPPAPPAPPSPK